MLTTFCGLRPSEAQQTEWSAVNFEEGWIRVEAQTSKVRQRRVVYPLPMALAWLKRARDAGSPLPMALSTQRRSLRALRDKLGLTIWPKDVTRHTAASYWLARRYKALVPKAEAETFWNLTPDALPALGRAESVK